MMKMYFFRDDNKSNLIIYQYAGDVIPFIISTNLGQVYPIHIPQKH